MPENSPTLGDVHRRKWSTQNYKEAVKWFQVAEQGLAIAQSNLGGFITAEGVSKNYKEAVKWFTKSAEQGFANSQAMVGVCYHHGLGVAKNLVEGYAWYNVAIANGNEKAKKWIKEIELSSEQLIEAQSLSTEIFKRTPVYREELTWTLPNP